MFSNRAVDITNNGRMGRHGGVCEELGGNGNRFVSRVTDTIEDLNTDSVSTWGIRTILIRFSIRLSGRRRRRPK